METPEYAEKLVKLLIKRAIGREINNFSIESQKAYNGVDRKKHGIRLDVFVKVLGKDNKVREVYDIEPNAYRVKNIAKRNRYYNALTDSKLLNSKDDYENLPELITIWVLPYDPFGKDRMIYTIKNIVTENPEIVYNDGISTIFLNISGNIGGSKELNNLLKYIAKTNENTAVDEELKNIQNIVHTIKETEEVGERYMGMQTTLYYEKKLSFEKGEQRGIQIGQEEMERNLLKLGISQETINQAKHKSSKTNQE